MSPGTDRAVSRALLFVTVFLIGLTLKLAEDLFAPIFLGIMLGIVISPLSRLFERMRLPGVLAALVTLCVAFFGIYATAILLEPTISRMIRNAPLIWAEIRETAAILTRVVRDLESVSQTLNETLAPNADANGEAATAAEAQMPSLTGMLFAAPAVLGQTLLFFGTLFFFVLCKHESYSWIARQIDSVSTDFVTTARLEQAERDVARYFLAVTIINVVFGICVGGAMQLIGLPGAPIWGLAAFLLNYIPYLGPIVLSALLFVAGQVTLDGLAALLPPLVFLSFNMVEGYFATPTFIGRSMRINPLLIFLSLSFWLWLWGPLGGLLALPIVIWGLSVAGSLERPAPPATTSRRGSESRPAGPHRPLGGT